LLVDLFEYSIPIPYVILHHKSFTYYADSTPPKRYEFILDMLMLG